ncbi:tyrosine-type recombinase/integrase [Flaviaesturariibacter terrae]
MKVYLLKRKGQLSKENAASGRARKISLYLVYYFGPDQKREYQFLDLFLYDKPKNQIEKDHNKQTESLAKSIQAQRILDSQNANYGFVSQDKGKVGVLVYFKQLVDKKFDSIGNHGNWLSTYQHLSDFVNGKDVRLDQIDEKFLEAFKEYLLACKVRKGIKFQRLNRNTALSYFNKLRAALREAYINKLIKENPALRVKCIKGQQVHREFLTVEELKVLANTSCEDPILAKAFLFGSLTGLRFSDIKNLKWGQIRESKEHGLYIQYIQKKTKKPEILPVSENALKLIGMRGEQEDLVFSNLQYSAHRNKMLQEWVKKAGIDKKISFHCSRHTQAVMQLSLGTDVFTVSKLLGHQNIKTTMHYLHIVDKTKKDAVSKMPALI